MRNSFTHSIDSTSSYIFHRKIEGKVKPITEHMLPNHPFDNINDVVEDIIHLIAFIALIISDMKKILIEEIALINISLTLPCGRITNDEEYWNLKILRERYEFIFSTCDSPCDKAITYEKNKVCRPTTVYFNRIHSKAGKYDGQLITQMTFVDIEKANRKTE